LDELEKMNYQKIKNKNLNLNFYNLISNIFLYYKLSNQNINETSETLAPTKHIKRERAKR